MIYRYSGIDAHGKKVRSKVEATSLEEAKSKLRANGIIYTSINEEKPSLFEGFSFHRKKQIAPKDLANLSRELAMYMRSGIGIVQAIKIAKNHYEQQKSIALFLEALGTYLDEGETLYGALEKQKVITLPEFYKQSIKVSEDGGILDEVLLELSHFLKEQDRIKKEIKSAFAYPGFMVVVSLFMIAFMLSFVVPQITAIFASMNQELPTPTVVVIALGKFFEQNFVWLLVAIVAFISGFLWLKRKNSWFSYKVDAFVLHLPFFGEMVQKSELARFAYMASLLVRSGIAFVQTINLSANILNNSVIKQLFLDASKEVVEGKLLSSSLNNATTKVDFAFIQAVAIGEETSDLEAVLSNVSQLYFEENKDKTAMLLTFLEPTLMLVVGGSIGFIVAAMLLPIFSMSIQ
jgi:general secretion pathway protein F/type IV pilus assembly protein PilC